MRRRLANVERNSFKFSSNDYQNHRRGSRRQHTHRTRAPPFSPRYHLRNTLSTSSASPPSLSGHLIRPDLEFQTLAPGELYRPWTTSLDRTTTRASTTGRHPILQSTAVLTLIVVASLSLVVGAIYLIIYFKSIKPMSARSRNYMQAAAAGTSVGGGGGGGKMTDDDGGRSRSTHPFFRRS